MREERRATNGAAGPRRFGDILVRRDRFIYTVELVPGRGSRGKRQDEILSLAQDVARGGLVDALSITDNPGGHPTLAPDVIGAEVCRMEIDPIIHFTCKDKNRNQIESILYALDRLGIRNVLAMTGDYPLYGFQGKAKPVYDVDSIQLLHLIGRMNRGLAIDDRAPGGGAPAPPIHMVKGCAVSPFKQLEPETMAQYFKLWKKVRAGADFVVTQVGFDARKFDELLRAPGIDVPVLGNVYVLTLPVARVMNRNGVPGCVVTDKLFRACEEESRAADRGRSASLERAARLVALLRGIGYDGAHIGGPNLSYGDIEYIIGRSEELRGEWQPLVPEFDYPQERGFYLYERDPSTGLNSDVPRPVRARPRATARYMLMRAFHGVAFAEGAPLYRAFCSFFRLIAGTSAEEVVTVMEYWLKFITSRCRRCGDCTLAEVAFLCPQSQCPKFLFNGQCGGSFEGWCEVFPGVRRCIFVRAYERLASHGEELSLKGAYIRPRDWSLDQTSSWANYFLGRDHRGQTCDRGP
ncbi:MAG: methylenetetrahydrofolate reductase C-terminal domain-containing protein [Syntrophorhabdales bacterium]|jgi:methylenetetrahydrofolate reductase (NADPH)